MSTSVPLIIPLHFASSSRPQVGGPIVPKDWQEKWHRTDYPRPAVDVTQGFDEDWPDEDLKRWATCMEVWEEEAVSGIDAATEGSALSMSYSSVSKPNILNADENGDETGQDIGASSGSGSMGRSSGRTKVALGFQNGTIWLYKEKGASLEGSLQRPEPITIARSASRSSILTSEVLSPSSASIAGKQISIDPDDAFSPTVPIAGTSDVNVLASPVRNSTCVDAEESLETQWHAGRENHTVVGGMMEALGLNNSTQHLTNAHSHSHSHSSSHTNSHSNSQVPSGSSTPYTPPHQRRPAQDTKKASRISLLNLPSSPSSSSSINSRSRTASNATSSGQWDREGAAEHNSNERLRLSKLMNAATAGTRPRMGSVATQDTHEEGNPLQEEEKKKRKKKSSERKKVEELEVSVALQSPSSSPVISLVSLSSIDRLASLQEDGTYILWSLRDAIAMSSINLLAAPSVSVESTTAPATLPVPSHSLSPFVNLRSSTNSPAPRSRANSGATQPAKAILEGSIMQGVSRMCSMRAIKTSGQPSTKPLLLCFDDVKLKVSIVGVEEARIYNPHSLQGCGPITPAARMNIDEEYVEVFYVNTRGTISLQPIRVAPTKALASVIESHKANTHLSSASAFLRREGLSNATSRAPSIVEERGTDSVDLGKGGMQEAVIGLYTVADDLILTWTGSGVQLMRQVADSLVVIDSLDVEGLLSVTLKGDTFLVESKIGTSLYSIEQGSKLQHKVQYLANASPIMQTMSTLACSAFRCFLLDDRLHIKCDEGIIWQGEARQDARFVTASLPYSMERVVLSLSSGHMAMSSLSDLVSGKLPLPALDIPPDHKGTVVLLRLVVNPRTQVKHVVGGTEEGDVIFWDATTLKKQAERSLLTCPVVDLVILGKEDNTLRLNGCLACVGADGSLVVFLLDGLQELYTIPGRGVPLQTVAVRADELLLIYDDSRARVWDMRKLELRRSIGLDQALALLDDGKGWWSQYKLGASQMKIERGSSGVLASNPSCRDFAAGSMTANLRRAIEAASRMISSANTIAVLNALSKKKDNRADDVDPVDEQLAVKRSVSVSITSTNGKKVLHTLRSLMQCLMPLGVTEEGDELSKKLLDVSQVEAAAWVRSGTFSSSGCVALAMNDATSSKGLLSISPVVTTARLLALTAMLLVVSNINELQSSCDEYLTLLQSISALVGEASFQPACLAMLTDYITDSVTELQQAAQKLFTMTLSVMSQDQIDRLCSEWTQHLPSRNGGPEASKALLLLGLIATERYTMLPPALLKEVANSITLFIREDALPVHQSPAIILCDRGFTIFQHYFDAMDIVRSLFSLSTNKNQDSKEEIIVPTITVENRALARKAVLQIAEDNTPLFMTTLSMDILHAQSPAHCNATMRLVALMVRKRPLILFPNLPRLAEAVVKSLDPTITSLRSVIHRSATIIISELITTYPTISFQKDLQRLAVGTFEGAIIMYDLKTSTRLYVIEAHQRGLSGLSFSQDGRRLISISLHDAIVKVWKTGVGFTSFLNFGGAPRQGGLLSSGIPAASAGSSSTLPSSNGSNNNHGSSSEKKTARGTTPYKSYEFVRMAEEGDSEREATDLALISFDWIGLRSVRIKVGKTSMTFDVQ
ncbi:hypothetical protein CBS101457_002706 [Exobasidium rhododendri]|nr:hypothetical protein CBS101457_002706 [Exobasidium rhododendri]